MVVAAAELMLTAELVLTATAAAVQHGRRTLRVIVASVVLVVVTATAVAVLPDRRSVFFVVFEALLSSEVATVLEHVSRVRVQRPERTLARFVGRPGHFDETVVKRQRVPDGVLPPLLVLTVERKQIHDELIDF